MATIYPSQGKGKQWSVKALNALTSKDVGNTVSDGGGLSGDIRQTKEGNIVIRFRYAFKWLDKLQWFNCGFYPETPISEIRANRDKAKALLLDGINPNEKREVERLEKQKVIEKALQEAKQRELEKVAANNRTLGQYLQNHYEAAQSRKAAGTATINIIKSNFKSLLNTDMSTLTKADIHAWQSKREKQGIAHSTLVRAYGALKTLLNHAVTESEILQFNPLSNVNLKAPNAKDKTELALKEKNAQERRMFTDDENSRLMFAINEFEKQKPNHWFIPFFYIALYTGLRTGDIYTLQWGTELNITFGRLQLTPNKTQHNKNPAEINQHLSDHLKSILTKYWEHQGQPNSGYVFLNTETGKPLRREAHYRHWRKLLELGGLPNDLVTYSLRHNFISTLIAEGIPLFEVARLAGHKKTEMIENHYGHLSPKKAKEATDLLADTFARAASLHHPKVTERNHGL